MKVRRCYIEAKGTCMVNHSFSREFLVSTSFDLNYCYMVFSLGLNLQYISISVSQEPRSAYQMTSIMSMSFLKCILSKKLKTKIYGLSILSIKPKMNELNKTYLHGLMQSHFSTALPSSYDRSTAS